ncbi:DinB family protein [Rossellomorea aquimaris]|uniref:DinB family protein n=1 Tax=Rossellomorea aquimaris TaxID=189382 RepID=UPI00149621EE|nr:DinB family protein [Rossellomorea aquimaris]
MNTYYLKEVMGVKDPRENILFHHQEFIRWAHSLNSLPKEEWHRPVEEGKWSIAEIVGHFEPWDEFVVNKRLPFLGTKEPLPHAPYPQMLNDESASKARTSEQSVVIERFILSREQLIESLEGIPPESWEQTLKPGNKEITLIEYLEGLAEHDLHHKREVDRALSKRNAGI